MFLIFPDGQKFGKVEMRNNGKDKETMTMFEEMTLGKRIASGIALMLVLMLVVGAAGYYGLSRVDTVMGVYRQVNALQSLAAAFRDESSKYMLSEMQDDAAGKEAAQKAAFLLLEQGDDMLADLESMPGITHEEKQGISSARDAMNTYKANFEAYVSANIEKTGLTDQIESEFEQMFKEVEGAEFWNDDMVFTARIMSNYTSSYINRASETNWLELERGVGEFSSARDEWAEKTSNSEMLSQRADRILEALEKYVASVKMYREQILLQDQLRNTMDQAQQVLFTACMDLGEAADQKLQAQTGLSSNIIFFTILAALVIGIIYAAVSIRKIVGRINKVIDGVMEGTEQMASSSEHIASDGQSLSDGASRQAAAIEETSSALEEISSMVKQNAENAGKAKEMTREAEEIVAQVDHNMNDMSVAIKEISDSSQETDKIVKTIDEIAFQTNLLALNAAVEAARAGSAGAGFAVVADEVRNLAMRAADAAKNTAELIGNTMKSVEKGSRFTKATQDSFKKNMEISAKVGALVDEIAEASREQSEGIESVGQAVTDMDSVVQQNAASAEESASAAEQMNAQVHRMKEYLDALASLVRRRNGNPRSGGEDIRPEENGELEEVYDAGHPLPGPAQKQRLIT
jgi:methyl-accepting chemotaxis protein